MPFNSIIIIVVVVVLVVVIIVVVIVVVMIIIVVVVVIVVVVIVVVIIVVVIIIIIVVMIVVVVVVVVVIMPTGDPLRWSSRLGFGCWANNPVLFKKKKRKKKLTATQRKELWVAGVEYCVLSLTWFRHGQVPIPQIPVLRPHRHYHLPVHQAGHQGSRSACLVSVYLLVTNACSGDPCLVNAGFSFSFRYHPCVQEGPYVLNPFSRVS